MADAPVEVAKDTANYTLAMNVSQVKGDKGEFYDDGQHAYVRLTIRFPSPDFANRMKDRMKERVRISEQNLTSGEDAATANNRRKQEQAIFSEDSKILTSDKREVYIILPLSVEKVEADSRGIFVSFDPKKEAEAKRWNGYSKIWVPRWEKAKHELRIPYNWSHRDLAKVVDR